MPSSRPEWDNQFRESEGERNSRLRAMRLSKDYRDELKAIHSALDDALGDSDVTHVDDDALRDEHPTQWAAMRLAKLIQKLS